MQRLQSIFKAGKYALNDLWAALMMFTRLPWWRLYSPSAEHFRNAVNYWPIAGWVTGGIMALVFAGAVQILAVPYAVLLAIIARILVTGALHEDGLADFCDGMGGGSTRERTLEIMKDSHIGTYGVIGLILYFLMLYNCIQELPMMYLKQSLSGEMGRNPILMVCAMMLTADVWGKSCASFLISQLPYARREEEAKTRLIYSPLQIGWQLVRILIALVPVALLWYLIGWMPNPLILAVPIVVEALLSLYMHHRLQGYTGDCCGATFLLCEISIYIANLVNI